MNNPNVPSLSKDVKTLAEENSVRKIFDQVKVQRKNQQRMQKMALSEIERILPDRDSDFIVENSKRPPDKKPKVEEIDKEASLKNVMSGVKKFSQTPQAKSVKNMALFSGGISALTGNGEPKDPNQSFVSKAGDTVKNFGKGALLGAGGAMLGSEMHTKTVGTPGKRIKQSKFAYTIIDEMEKEAALPAMGAVGAAAKAVGAAAIKHAPKIGRAATKLAPKIKAPQNVANAAKTFSSKLSPTMKNAGKFAENASKSYKKLPPLAQDAIGGGTMDVAWGGFGKDNTPGASNDLASRTKRMAGDFASGAVFDMGISGLTNKKYRSVKTPDGWERQVKKKYGGNA